MVHYDSKLYIPTTLQVDLLQKNHGDPLAGHFEDKKTLEFLSRKYYWPRMRVDFDKYL